MSTSLFRQEVIESKRQRLFGEVTVAQPLAFSVLTGFLLLVAVSVGLFLATGSFARKETAPGYLQPDLGVIDIYPPAAGILQSLTVEEGDTVAAGDVLATVLTERISIGGTRVGAAMLDSVNRQIEETEEQIAIARDRAIGEEKRLNAEIAGLEEEQAEIEAQIAVQRDLVVVARDNLDSIEELTGRGVISETEYKRRQEQVLSYEQQLAGLRQRLAEIGNRIEQSQMALTGAPLNARERLSELSAAHAALMRQKAELEGQRAMQVVAPVSGRIGAVRLTEGGRADQTALMTLLPEGSELEAHLMVPTRAIGFLAEGQEVRLSYDAFNYRRFGVYEGRIRKISRTILGPGEIVGPIQLEEPAYRVTVALADQDVEAYGQQVPLQPGMTLSADIILEDRSLIDWLLDPLLSLRGRV